jgi:hypothetical protein
VFYIYQIKIAFYDLILRLVSMIETFWSFIALEGSLLNNSPFMLSSVCVNSKTAWIPLQNFNFLGEPSKQVHGLYVCIHDCFMFATYSGVSHFSHIFNWGYRQKVVSGFVKFQKVFTGVLFLLPIVQYIYSTYKGRTGTLQTMSYLIV